MMHFPRRAIAAIRNRAAAARGFVTRNKATAAKPTSAANTLYNSSARSTTHGLQRATGVPATCHVGVATGNFSHPAGCGWGGLGLAPTATQNAATQPLAGGGLGEAPPQRDRVAVREPGVRARWGKQAVGMVSVRSRVGQRW